MSNKTIVDHFHEANRVSKSNPDNVDAIAEALMQMVASAIQELAALSNEYHEANKEEEEKANPEFDTSPNPPVQPQAEVEV